MASERPSRAELFGFYYLGFSPDGEYRFATANHLARHYGVGPEAILKWLEQYGIDPATVSKRRFEFAAWSVDLQMDAPNMTPEAIRARIDEALAAFDDAGTGRRPWVDGPIT